MTSGPPLSLKGRALRLLSQREHSRSELERKLARHAETESALERVLTELEDAGLLSQERFAQSLAYRRAPRFGLRRIQQELATHRVDATIAASVLASVRDGERDRALQVWQKRFGVAPIDAHERARQHRFLMQRGFTGEAIASVFRKAGDPSGEDA